MLVLHRTVGQRILIGEGIEIHIVSTKNTSVMLGVTAPPEFKVTREDNLNGEQHENKQKIGPLF